MIAYLETTPLRKKGSEADGTTKEFYTLKVQSNHRVSSSAKNYMAIVFGMVVMTRVVKG
jgi:hypothetical protein